MPTKSTFAMDSSVGASVDQPLLNSAFGLVQSQPPLEVPPCDGVKTSLSIRQHLAEERVPILKGTLSIDLSQYRVDANDSDPSSQVLRIDVKATTEMFLPSTDALEDIEEKTLRRMNAAGTSRTLERSAARLALHNLLTVSKIVETSSWKTQKGSTITPNFHLFCSSKYIKTHVERHDPSQQRFTMTVDLESAIKNGSTTIDLCFYGGTGSCAYIRWSQWVFQIRQSLCDKKGVWHPGQLLFAPEWVVEFPPNKVESLTTLQQNERVGFDTPANQSSKRSQDPSSSFAATASSPTSPNSKGHHRSKDPTPEVGTPAFAGQERALFAHAQARDDGGNSRARELG
ncbi:hypothetical protein T439DRAFT_359882 [Meredithblackwellia eburnea MCA 4105]